MQRDCDTGTTDGDPSSLLVVFLCFFFLFFLSFFFLLVLLLLLYRPRNPTRLLTAYTRR
jgi:hypothetical protein